MNEGIAAVADAIAADLAALDLGQPATVSRAFFPYKDREDLGPLTLTVMPRGQERTVAARGGLSQVDHLIDVGIQRRIVGSDEASLAATVGESKSNPDAKGFLLGAHLFAGTWVEENRPRHNRLWLANAGH